MKANIKLYTEDRGSCDYQGEIESELSLRDYFAAKAIQGELSSSTEEWNCPDSKIDNLAERAYLIADAMLKARGE